MARKTAPDWTPEEDEWLREFYPRHQNCELAEGQARAGWPRDEQAIARRARTLGIRKDRPRGYVRKCRTATIWTPERDEWFRAFVPGHTEGEIIAEHERVFGFPLTVGQVANRKHTLGVRSGTHGGRFAKGSVPPNKGKTWDEYLAPEVQERCRATQFKKGQLNGTAKERDHGLLGVRVTKGGYREIRVDPRGERHTMERWIPLGAFNWMAANGREWPEGCKCVHVDRDVANDAAENIVPVPNDLWPLVNGSVKGQVPWHDRETLEVAITSARISLKRRELERRRRALEGHPWAQDLAKGDK